MNAGSRPICLYLRLSKYHKDGQDAIERQRIDLTRKLAAEGGWTVMGEYVDNDSASASAVRTRKGWHALNVDIDAGRVTAVAFWKLDRTNRVASRCIEWIGQCQTRGVTLVSHQDASDELNTATAGAKLITGIKALLAEVETDTMSERQRAAKAHAAEAGFHHGGRRPFGWMPGHRETDALGRSGVRLVPHPVEFAALQAAVPMVLAGSGLMSVSRHWMDEFGITTAAGMPMYEASVYRALISPRMVGYRMRQVPEHQRGVQIDLLNHIARDQSGEPVIGQEPVCDRLTWMRMLRALQAASTSQTRRPWGSHEWLLTGLMFCQCGNRLYGHQKNYKHADGSNVRTYVYRCHANLRNGAGTCAKAVAVQADRAEAFVEGWLFAYLSDERLAKARAEAAAARQASNPNNGLVTDLDTARAERDALLSQQGSREYKGAMVSVLVGLLAEVQARIDKLEGRLDAVQIDDLPVILQADLASRWPDMDLGQRRRLLARVIERIDAQPGRGPVADRLSVSPRVRQ
ncbi:Site-specific DNA recombinase [Nakamurella panacisegetis]|uniref:Site-specific DNA recombinase n=1 Tax=Nakamurella panacisegetis TaxID=1090615 RepID=A0A1H0RCL9_9ACTN|nr:recombinase family protein [Nakamurella panacisegetis]SDP27362.1 Site-specific DNA recombinase [Nakamurella panacisegetis]